jgi:uncharacterized protein
MAIDVPLGFSVLVLAALCLGCSAQRPGELTAEDLVHGARVACELDGSQARPLVLDMPAMDRGALEATMQSSLAVVSYDCERLAILPGCRIEGSYAYVGVTIKEEQIRLVDLDEVQANLPFGALDVDVSSGRTVDVAMMLVGQLSTPLAAVSKDRLSGDCEGATHYVRGASVGAFAMTQGTNAETHAAAKLLLEAGSAQLSRKQTTRRDGSIGACRQASTEDVEPRDNCGALLRVELTALDGDGDGGGGDRTDERGKVPVGLRRICPKNFVLAGDKCTRAKPKLSYRCEYGDTRNCVKQCRGGNIDSCVVLGVMHAHGFGAPKDAARAEELLGGACRPNQPRGGHVVACGELGVLEQGGHVGPPDVQRAEVLFDKACKAGRSQSCLDLAVLRWYGPSEVRDQKRAADSFERGCRAGSLRSCTRLGMVLFLGGGVARDQRRSRTHLKRACDIGDDLACAQVAMLLFYGLGGPADPSEAALMAQTACDAGEAAGCTYLGLAYDLGKGADEDKGRAYELFNRACLLDRDHCAQYGFFARMRRLDNHGRSYSKSCRDTRKKPYGPPLECPILDDYVAFCEAGVVRSCGIAAGMLFWFMRDGQARSFAERACRGGDPRGCTQLEIIDSGQRGYNPKFRTYE